MTATVLSFVSRPRSNATRVGPFGEVIRFVPRPRVPKLETVLHALVALSLDKLGTVTRGRDRVFVMTAHGIGEFPVAEWDAATRRPA